jgi:DNA-directed RNA polymerase specialized sigma subunit
MYFFQNYTKTDIAKLYGVNHSTISRRINKSIDILYEKLKYAAEYRFGIVIEKRC